MKVTRKLKHAAAGLMAAVLVITGMTGYRAGAEVKGAEKVSWQCMDGSNWNKYYTYVAHDKTSRAWNTVTYFVAEKSSASLKDLCLKPTSEFIMTMYNNETAEGTEEFLTSGDTAQFYMTTGKVTADDFTEDDLVLNNKTVKSVTVNDKGELAYNQSQNDTRKILTDEYTSMKIVNGDKYMVIWFKAGVPADQYDTVTDWTKLCTKNGNDIFYSISLNRNGDSVAEVSLDDAEENVNIVANSSASIYKSGRFYKVDGTNEALTASLYKNKTYPLSLEMLSEQGCSSLYLAAQNSAGSTFYGFGIDFKVVPSEGEIETGTYTVTIDNNPVEVAENAEYTLGDAQYGYYDADANVIYKAGAKITVTDNIVLTSINELSVNMAYGAGIRYIGSAGIRFQSSVVSDNMDAVASDAITEGTLITASDIYEAKGEDLTITSDYTKLNVANSGWYNGTVGTYCGSICDVVESNYIRNFTARAYVTINYENGETMTVYSGMGPVRSISQVASAVKDAGYAGIAEEYKSIIDSLIK